MTGDIRGFKDNKIYVFFSICGHLFQHIVVIRTFGHFLFYFVDPTLVHFPAVSSVCPLLFHYTYQFTSLISLLKKKKVVLRCTVLQAQGWPLSRFCNTIYPAIKFAQWQEFGMTCDFPAERNDALDVFILAH